MQNDDVPACRRPWATNLLQRSRRQGGPHDRSSARFPYLFIHVPQFDPLLAETNHVIAPDSPGFGHSDAPGVTNFDYTFDNLADVMEDFLLKKLGLKKFSIYVQDYGAPVGYRIAAANPHVIDKIVVQNGNAYEVGIGSGFDPMKPFWQNRNSETEKTVRALLSLETTRFQYLHGVKDPSRISPDTYTLDQSFWIARATRKSNSIFSRTIRPIC